MPKKKTCNRYRALTYEYVCELGFKTKKVYFDGCVPIGATPLEECPKPKTINKYRQQLKLKERK